METMVVETVGHDEKQATVNQTVGGSKDNSHGLLWKPPFHQSDPHNIESPPGSSELHDLAALLSQYVALNCTVHGRQDILEHVLEYLIPAKIFPTFQDLPSVCVKGSAVMAQEVVRPGPIHQRIYRFSFDVAHRANRQARCWTISCSENG